MLDHEESPEKPEYNMATSPFLDTLPPPHNFALTPPTFFLPKSHPPLYEGGGVWGGGRTMTGAAND